MTSQNAQPTTAQSSTQSMLGSSTANLEKRVMTRSALLINHQTRLGLVAMSFLMVALGALFIPYIGWLHFSLWATPVMLTFGGRQIWQERLLKKGAEELGQHLRRLLYASIFAGWLVISSVLIFGPSLPDGEFYFLVVIMACWIVAAVSILGVIPKLYGLYLVVSALMVMSAFATRSSTEQSWVIVPGFAFGILMIYRMAVGMRGLVDESVRESARNELMSHHLAQLNEEQRRAQMNKSRFLAAASHDMKQPVQAMGILVNVLQKTVGAGPAKQVANEIELATHAIDSMFAGILDLARIDAGDIKAKIQPLDLIPLLMGVLAGYRHRCELKGLALNITSPRRVIVQSDPLLLQRILTNLLDNALKYTERGRIDLAVNRDAKHVKITISDTGIGLDPNERTQISEPFFRGQKAQLLGVNGLGLGLAVIDHMLPLIGAHLEMFSRTEGGTRVVLSTPFPTGEFVDTSAEYATTSHLRGKTVVVVEDDAMTKNAMRLWLESLGATAHCASGFQDLPPIIESLDVVDAFLIDYNLGTNLPNGLEVAEKMRVQFPDALIILVSGNTNLSNQVHPFLVLQKPANVDEIARLIVQHESSIPLNIE